MAARLDLSSPITLSKLSLKSSHPSLSSSSSRQTTWSPPFKGSTSRLSKSTSAPNKPSTCLRLPPCALPPGALPPGLRTVSSSAVPRVAASAAAASAADFPAAGSGPDEPPFNLNPEELQEELSRAFRSAKKQSKVALRKIADGTAGALRCAQSKVAEFERDNDLRGKAREAVGAANERLEEVAFEAERHAFRFDAQFGVSSRVEEMKRAVVGAAYDYLKRWAEFRTTPAGQLVMFVAFAWLLISGWLAQIFLWSLCIVPLLPLLARALAKAAFVEKREYNEGDFEEEDEWEEEDEGEWDGGDADVERALAESEQELSTGSLVLPPGRQAPRVKSAVFVKSSSSVAQCPKDTKIPEFAVIGRSNVGKSSLINMLTNHKGLAQTSKKPGKTQLINHFLINDSWYLVDLPGYGTEWNASTKAYFTSSTNLLTVLLLLTPPPFPTFLPRYAVAPNAIRTEWNASTKAYFISSTNLLTVLLLLTPPPSPLSSPVECVYQGLLHIEHQPAHRAAAVNPPPFPTFLPRYAVAPNAIRTEWNASTKAYFISSTNLLTVLLLLTPPPSPLSSPVAPNAIRTEWNAFTKAYFTSRTNLLTVLLLVDATIPPQAIDVECADWLGRNKLLLPHLGITIPHSMPRPLTPSSFPISPPDPPHCRVHQV
ncbi:unnamed protein product [Closterium sp. NIES-65]|nr:unnamed protein product [Closterium sp. NIES-65]